MARINFTRYMILFGCSLMGLAELVLGETLVILGVDAHEKYKVSPTQHIRVLSELLPTKKDYQEKIANKLIAMNDEPLTIVLLGHGSSCFTVLPIERWKDCLKEIEESGEFFRFALNVESPYTDGQSFNASDILETIASVAGNRDVNLILNNCHSGAFFSRPMGLRELQGFYGLKLNRFAKKIPDNWAVLAIALPGTDVFTVDAIDEFSRIYPTINQPRVTGAILRKYGENRIASRSAEGHYSGHYTSVNPILLDHGALIADPKFTTAPFYNEVYQ